MPMVAARMYAVVIHAMCSMPLSSPTMVGRAVLTMVWSSAPSSIVSISAPKISPKLCGLAVPSSGAGSVPAGAGAWVMLRSPYVK